MVANDINALKIACKHLTESQDILEKKHSESIKKGDVKEATRFMQQMQKIGSILLDFEYRIKSYKEKK